MKSSGLWIPAGVLLAVFGNLAAAASLNISSGSAGFFDTPGAGAFSGIYTFTLPVAMTLKGIVNTVANGGQNIDFTSIVLTGPTGPSAFGKILPDPFETWTLSTGTLSAGAYTLTLIGTNSPAMATYSGNLAVAPVPEPDTYAMMLAGLGVIGFLALRHRH